MRIDCIAIGVIIFADGQGLLQANQRRTLSFTCIMQEMTFPLLKPQATLNELSASNFS